jgi:hypothetical protein
MTKRSKQKTPQYLMTKMCILVIFPLILLLLPGNLFDNGRYTICIFKLLTGDDCYACGLTRACMHLTHLDIQQARAYNPLSFVVLPILSGALLFEWIKTYRQYRRIRADNTASNH